MRWILNLTNVFKYLISDCFLSISEGDVIIEIFLCLSLESGSLLPEYSADNQACNGWESDGSVDCWIILWLGARAQLLIIDSLSHDKLVILFVIIYLLKIWIGVISLKKRHELIVWVLNSLEIMIVKSFSYCYLNTGVNFLLEAIVQLSLKSIDWFVESLFAAAPASILIIFSIVHTSSFCFINRWTLTT